MGWILEFVFMFLARITGGGLDSKISIYLSGPEYLEGWKLECVFLIARRPGPVVYVVLVQYNWRTGY
jgi:hypothetical protein